MSEGPSLRAPGARQEQGPELAASSRLLGVFDPAQVPPLSGLSAFAALCAMAINQLLLPGLGTQAERVVLFRLERAGLFATNLAVIAGFIALAFGTIAVLRGTPHVSNRRRLLVILFGALLARAVIVATFFDRSATTTENVYLAVGAAHLLAVLFGMTAIEGARGVLLRTVACLATAAPLFALLTVTLELSGDVSLDPWKRKAHVAFSSAGEIGYLGLLLASFPLLVPRALGVRDLLARAVGLCVLVAAAYGVNAAYGTMGTDYSVLLYNAQRVGLLLERWPLGYALPLCVALSAVAIAIVSGGRARVQAAAGMVLVFASGYAPRAPGRLLTMTLGALLLARAIWALAQARRPHERTR